MGMLKGREIAVSLLRHVRALKNVELMEWTTSVDLLMEWWEGCGGLLLLDGEGGLRMVLARAVLLGEVAGRVEQVL